MVAPCNPPSNSSALGNEAPISEWAKRYIKDFGIALVPIPPRSKGPKTLGWNTPGGYLTDADEACGYFQRHPHANMGVLHSASRTAVLDNDHPDLTDIALRAVGLNPASWLTLGARSLGNPYRTKAWFRAPPRSKLTTRALVWPAPTAGEDQIKVFELRAGPVQDVAPPSNHPNGYSYCWDSSPWELGGFPEMPRDLAEFWQDWDAQLHAMQAACPWARRIAETDLHHAVPNDEWSKLYRELRERVPLEPLLLELGAQHCRGSLWLCPFHPEHRPSMWTFVGNDGTSRWCCAHGAAPFGKETTSGYSMGDAIDLYAALHRLSLGNAAIQLARQLGLSVPRTVGHVSASRSSPHLRMPSLGGSADELLALTHTQWRVLKNDDLRPVAKTAVAIVFECAHASARSDQGDGWVHLSLSGTGGLAESLDVHSKTVTRHLDELVEMGVIERRLVPGPGPDGQRSHLEVRLLASPVATMEQLARFRPTQGEVSDAS